MKPSTQIDLKGCDWAFICRGELLMYVPEAGTGGEEKPDIRIVCGADHDEAIIMVVKPQKFDAETEFIDACTTCGKRGVADDEKHECYLPKCPECGEHAELIHHSSPYVERHGLDAGPFETGMEYWVQCSKCGSKMDEREVMKFQEAAV
jgi:predicted RNA-binding Zn-ribbon protein involved in translation (DUF1610 family)